MIQRIDVNSCLLSAVGAGIIIKNDADFQVQHVLTDPSGRYVGVVGDHNEGSFLILLVQHVNLCSYYVHFSATSTTATFRLQNLYTSWGDLKALFDIMVDKISQLLLDTSHCLGPNYHYIYLRNINYFWKYYLY